MSDTALARGDLKNITITIGGERIEVTGWTGLQIIRGIDQAADAFSFSFPWEATDENRTRFVAYKTSLIEIKYDSEVIVSGIAEKYEPSVSQNGIVMTINGRSRSGVTLDISAGPPFEIAGSFNAISSIISPIPVSASPDISDLTAQIEPGQSVWDVLSRIASAHNLYAFPQADGSLVFRRLRGGSPVAHIREGITPVIAIDTSMDLTRRYHRYIAIRTADGETQRAEALDNGVDKVLRDGLIVEPQQEADVTEAAKFQRARGIMESFTCSLSLAGWTVNGALWRPGMTVLITYPSAMIYNDSTLMVRRATMQLDEQGGAVTQLDLTFPEVFAGGQPGFPYPWSLT